MTSISTCISRHGEFSSHTHTTDPLTCDLCGVFDEDSARQRIATLEDESRNAAATALTQFADLIDTWPADGPRLSPSVFSTMARERADDLRQDLRSPA